MLDDVVGDSASVGVVTAPGRLPDNEAHDLVLVKILTRRAGRIASSKLNANPVTSARCGITTFLSDFEASKKQPAISIAFFDRS